MKPEQFDEFCELLDLVSEQYSKALSDGAKTLYWQGLVDFDLAAVREALYRHVRNPDTGMFMPKIADVVKMLQGSTQDSALNAWAKVDKAIRRVGTQVDVVFDDAIIHRVIQDMGGWMSFGQKQETEWPFVAKEFENRYRGFKARNEKIEYPKVMTGLYNAYNQTKGFALQPMTMIGNPEIANKVMLAGTDKPQLQITNIGEVLGRSLPLAHNNEAAA